MSSSQHSSAFVDPNDSSFVRLARSIDRQLKKITRLLSHLLALIKFLLYVLRCPKRVYFLMAVVLICEVHLGLLFLLTVKSTTLSDYVLLIWRRNGYFDSTLRYMYTRLHPLESAFYGSLFAAIVFQNNERSWSAIPNKIERMDHAALYEEEVMSWYLRRILGLQLFFIFLCLCLSCIAQNSRRNPGNGPRNQDSPSESSTIRNIMQSLDLASEAPANLNDDRRQDFMNFDRELEARLANPMFDPPRFQGRLNVPVADDSTCPQLPPEPISMVKSKTQSKKAPFIYGDQNEAHPRKTTGPTLRSDNRVLFDSTNNKCPPKTPDNSLVNIAPDLRY